MSAVVDLVSFTRQLEADLGQWVPAVIDQALSHVRTSGGRQRSVERRDVVAVEAALTDPGARGVRSMWLSELQALLLSVRQGCEAAGPTLGPQPWSGVDPLQLSLKDEQEVDEDVELSHLIQELESRAESALRDLRALCSALRGWQEVRPEAPPLHPQALAKTLGVVARALPLTPGGRLVLLRVWGTASSALLPQVYRQQLAQLQAAGVTPAQFQVRLTISAGRRESQAGEVLPNPAEASPSGHVQAILQQMLDAAGQAQAPVAASAPGQAMDGWMSDILRAVQQEAAAAPRMHQVLAQLADPGKRLAQVEPELWRQPEHVWWRLLDRLLALCAVLDAEDGGLQEQFAERCDAAVTKLCTVIPPSSTLCQEVLDEIDAAGCAVIQQREATRPGDGAPDEPRTQAWVREQLTQQLRHSAAPGSVRRFLLGPWSKVLVAEIDALREQPAQPQRYSAWVDDVLAALRLAPEPAALEALLDVAREGLSWIRIAPAQIEPWVSDLALRLRDVAQAQTLLRADWRHEDLPTVPIALHGSVHGARAKRDRIAWIRGLRVGDICRLFVDTEWRTAQLVNLPEADAKLEGVYVFQSRRPNCRHELTLRALERLRDEGLATTVESGTFIAQALDTMTAQLADS